MATEPIYAREKPEPSEASRPVPVWLLLLLSSLALWGSVYYLQTPVARSDWGDLRSEPEAMPAAADGKVLFAQNCAVCHQADGSGVAKVFPPLKDSEWVRADPEVMVHILLKGVEGPLQVKGSPYQGQMPSFESRFSNQEVVAIVEYVRHQLNQSEGHLEEARVAELRTRLTAHPGAWNGEKELRQALKEKAP